VNNTQIGSRFGLDEK